MLEPVDAPVTAVVLTGGRGDRFASRTPKQLHPVGGVPVFVHVLELYETLAEVDAVVLVVNPAILEEYDRVLAGRSFGKLRRLVHGGASREQSLRAALPVLSREGLVIVHNGVSPAVPPELVRACLDEAREHGASTAYVPAHATHVEIVDGLLVRSLPRQGWGSTIDPQVYRADLLHDALDDYEGTDNTPIVDLVMAVGGRVGVVESTPANRKLTFPSDLPALEHTLARAEEGE